MRLFVILAGACLAAGCSTSGGSGALSPLPQALASDARVTEVRVSSFPRQGVSSEFARVLRQGVRKKVEACADGTAPVTLDVSLDSFEKANPLMVGFLYGSNRIRGTARLIDQSGQVVGEYRIQRAYSSHGAVGVAMMAQAEEQMSAAFGDEVCKQAFAG